VAAALVLITIWGGKFTALKAAGPKTWLFWVTEGLCAALLGHYACL